MRLIVNAVGITEGGGKTHLRPLLDSLLVIRPDWDILVVVGPSRDLGLPEGVTVLEVPWSGAKARLWWDGLLVGREARRLQADAVLCVANYGPLLRGVPTVLYQRSSLYFDHRWLSQQSAAYRLAARVRRRLAKRMCSVARRVIVPSEAMAALLRDTATVAATTPIDVVPHGGDHIKLGAAPPRRCESRAIYVGSSARQKDLSTLIRAAALVERQRPGFEMVVTVSENELLRSDSSACDVPVAVKAAGRTADPTKLYESASVVVSQSVTESFGFAVLEALWAGVPLVCSDLPASREIAGDAALYFPVGDAVQCANAILRILEEGPPSAYDAVAAQVRVRFTWSRAARNVAESLEKASAGRES